MLAQWSRMCHNHPLSILVPLACLLAVLLPVGSVHAASGCQFLSAPAGDTPAFCDTFDAPAGIGNRSGDLNGTVWGVSRLGNTDLSGHFDTWYQVNEQQCGQSITVFPENSIKICDGQVAEAINDNTDVMVQAMYPKQPFDIAGRTGTVVFDVSDDSQGNHAAWPEFWYTDQPVPAPFVHEATLQSVPRNGVGIRLAACTDTCPNGAGYLSVDSVDVVRNYTSFDTFQGTSGSMTLQDVGDVKASTGPGNMNHFELRISQNQIDVYGTDAGTTQGVPGPLKHIAVITNANLTLTRGLIWLEDAHYNANKFNTQGQHTFTWDNVGFDGPVLPRDLTFDVPDCLCGGDTALNGQSGENLGWSVPSDGTTRSLSTLPMTAANIAAAGGGLLTFNYYSYTPVTLSYSLNGNAWHSVPWPYPDTLTYTWRTLAVPITLSELVAGANTLQLKSSDGTAIANVDLVLQGAGGGGSPETLVPLATPTTPIPPTATATVPIPPTSTPTSTATAINTPIPPTSTSTGLVTTTVPPAATAKATTPRAAGATVTMTGTAIMNRVTSTATPSAGSMAATTTTKVLPTGKRPMHNLVIHNGRRTVAGGRKAACDLAGNTNGLNEAGCEIVSSVSGPGATVTYTLIYPDKSTQIFTDKADRRGHSLHPFNASYLPSAGRQPVTIHVRAVLVDGTRLGPVTTHFAVMHSAQ